MEEQHYRMAWLSPFKIITLGFSGLIIAGTLLLMLPISSSAGIITPFHEAMFTAVSAVCVTGLVVQDTATYWSSFGQGIILLLIQIGGLGFLTVDVFFALVSGRKISLMQRSAMQEALSAPSVGGVVRLTKFILKATVCFELAGAFLLSIVFVRDFGLRGIWMGAFHSISAFCNAGFDIMGTPGGKYVSLTGYVDNPVVNITIILLIIIGGIGFLTWDDVATKRGEFRKYRLQSKVIIVTTAILIIFPTIFFFYVDFAGLPAKERFFSALFHAVTPRTAGFNTADITAMTGSGKAITILLMLIGGSPGSTAGGMKTTTVALMIANAHACYRRRDNAQFFGRRIETETVRHAATICTLYFSLFFWGAVAISVKEGLPITSCLFETASAVGTVGLSLGITQRLSIFSLSILMVLMFLGRVGGLTLIYAALSQNQKNYSRLPQERMTVG